MRAAQVRSLDGPSAVVVIDVPEPSPRDNVTGEEAVLIEVHAAGVAFPELLQTRGLYQAKPPLPYIPGPEVAGKVRWAPADSPLGPDDRVVGLPLYGGYAELASVRRDLVFRLPEGFGFHQGAAAVVNYLTAHFALLRRGRLAAGESVLVHGAAGGVGIAAIQVARAFGASEVFAVTSSTSRGEVAVGAGASAYFSPDDFRDRIIELTGGRGVDIVVDPVGGARFTDSVRALAVGGRVLVVGFTSGDIPTVRVNRLLLNNVDAVGVGWGSYMLQHPGEIASAWAELVPHMEAGRMTPVVGAVYPLEQVGDALTAIEERRAVGKVVLAVR